MRQRTPPPPWARRTADVLLAFIAASTSLSTTGMQAGAIGLIVLTLFAVAAGWDVVRRTPLDVAIGLLLAAFALSTLASGRPLQAVGWQRLWVVLTFFVAFWWLRDRGHAVRLARLAVLAAGVTAAYGILQHYTGADWYRMLLGRETAVKPRSPGASGYAIVGFFRNYLTFAHTMLFPLAWATAFALRGDRRGLVAAPLLVLALVFSTARGAWLGMLAIAASLVPLAGGRRAAIVVLATTAAAGVGFWLAPDLRSHATTIFSTTTNAGRIGIYRANLDIIHEHPVLGLGFGRYQRAAKRYYDAHPEADRRSHAHNNYLQVAAEAGLVGLAAFGLFLAIALWAGWTAVARAPDPATWATAAGAWAGLIAFLVGGLTQYSFGDNEVALTLWFTLAVLMRVREE